MAELQRKGQFDKLAELQYGQLPELEGRLQSTEASQQAASASEHPRLLRTQVGAEAIAAGVASATGIPVAKLMPGERDTELTMEDFLPRPVEAHNEATRPK